MENETVPTETTAKDLATKELAWNIPPNHKDRTVDWFWAVGLMTIIGAAAAFIVGNNLFGIFIILGGSLLFYTNMRNHEDHTVHLNEKDLTVNGLRYETKKMRGYSITKNNAEEDILIIRTDRILMPMLILHIPNTISIEELDDLISMRIPKEDLREPPANALAEKLGF